MPEPDDRALMAAHVRGDPDAFGTLVRRHRDRMWAVALRTTGNPQDAADAVQDAFVSALRGAKSYRGDAEVSTWLHRIVVNACIDRARRAAVRPTVALGETEPGEQSRVGAGSATPEAERIELAIDLERALARLPVDQRVAVVLVDVQGVPVSHAAEVLGVPEGTVKSRCARARARLAQLLAAGNQQDAGYVISAQVAARRAGSVGAADNRALTGPEEQA